tara:strand:- start:6 stop:1316 length:1311 start_codon:yes stop_codon:yes gene_type:complete
MALIDSNTFVEPTAATTLATARTQFNNSLRSLLTNFAGDGTNSSAPSLTSGNITRDGAATGIENGMLYRHSNTLVTALYINDSVNFKTAPVGGNFTRVGISTQIAEGGIAGLMNKMQHYEVGELISTVSAAGGATTSNGRLYMKLSNGTAASDLIDVGIPPTNGSISNTMVDLHHTTPGVTKTSGITGDRLNFAFDASKGLAGANAQIRVSAIAANPTAIAFGTINTANTAIVHYGSTTTAKSAAGKDGLNVLTQDGKTYGNLAVGTISVATRSFSPTTGATVAPHTDVAPLCPAGTIIMWAGADTAIPGGYKLCNGQSLDRTDFAALFDAIGTSYGSADSDSFNVPDFRDRLVAGKGSTVSRSFTSSVVITGSASAPKLTTTGAAASTTITNTSTISGASKDTSGTGIAAQDVSTDVPALNLQLASCGVNFLIKT